MEQNVFQILNKTATCMSYQLQDTSKSVSIIISQKRYKKYSIFYIIKQLCELQCESV